MKGIKKRKIDFLFLIKKPNSHRSWNIFGKDRMEKQKKKQQYMTINECGPSDFQLEVNVMVCGYVCVRFSFFLNGPNQNPVHWVIQAVVCVFYTRIHRHRCMKRGRQKKGKDREREKEQETCMHTLV